MRSIPAIQYYKNENKNENEYKNENENENEYENENDKIEKS